MAIHPALASLVGLVIGLVVIAFGIMRFGRGLDRTWSLANIQVILWTGVVLGSYSALSLGRGGFLAEVPENTMVLFGIASATLPISAIIRTVQEGGRPPTDRSSVATWRGGFLAYEKDPQRPSIAKMQMFAWNIVAIFLFVTFVGTNMNRGIFELPDIGGTLSTIIGISNGVYVANKTVDPPRP